MLKNFNIVIFILLICYFLNVGKENFIMSRSARRARARARARARREKKAVRKKMNALNRSSIAVLRKQSAIRQNSRVSNKSRSQY